MVIFFNMIMETGGSQRFSMYGDRAFIMYGICSGTSLAIMSADVLSDIVFIFC